MNNQDFRSELEMWCDLWDDAQEEGVHPPVPQAKPTDLGDFQGDSAQDDYFDYLDLESGLIQEEKVQNPIYPDTAGPDSDKGPVWVKEDFLKEVESLKNKLFSVENKMAQLGGDKKWSEKAQNMQSSSDKLMSEIKSLRKRLDHVSSQLGIKDEPSPWEIKRD